MSAHRVNAVGDVVDAEHVDLVWRDERIFHEHFHGHGARDQKARRHRQPWLPDPARVKKPAVDGRERDHLGPPELDDLSQQLRLLDSLHHAPSGVLAKDRLQLDIAVPRDDDEWAELGEALEIVEGTTLFAKN